MGEKQKWLVHYKEMVGKDLMLEPCAAVVFHGVKPGGDNFHLHGTEGVPSCLLDPWLLSKLLPPQPPQEKHVASSHIDNVPSFWHSG